MRLSLAAAAALAAAPAIAQNVEFTAPPDGSTFAVGTTVAPTGLATEGTIPGTLDITVILDRSGSTGVTPITSDPRSVLDIEVEATNALFDSLGDGTEVSVIAFSGSADAVVTDEVLAPGPRASIAAALDVLSPGGGTSFTAPLNLALSNGVEADDQFLFLSDGQASGGTTQAADIAAAGGTVSSVALPGASLDPLQDIADAGGGSLFDFRDNPGDIVTLFSGQGGGSVIGLAGLDVTLPDGDMVPVDANLVGQFQVPDFTLGLGENVFTVAASFDDGSTVTDTLTLIGAEDVVVNPPEPPVEPPVMPPMAPIPLPAAGWLLLAGLGALGLGRRRR